MTKLTIVNAITGAKFPVTECVLECSSSEDIFINSTPCISVDIDFLGLTEKMIFKPYRIEDGNYIFKSESGVEITYSYD